ncbi:isochorismatase family protein [Sphingomonas soli]|uniref:isochorismatase family protein n=1 Tax=Sphingomonas soli TaxID=266127 RepID=UPI000833E182|nr:isochorismatase family protein [Sphingomonas soli]
MTDALLGKPALLIVDIQNGTLGRAFAPRSAEECMSKGLKLAEAVRRAGGLVVVASSSFAPDLSDAPPGPVDRPMPILTSGLPTDWDTLPESLLAAADMLVPRPHWNVFHGTALDTGLRRRGIRDLIVAGLTTNFAIESTARSGWELGYAQWFAEDAMTSISDAGHRFAMETTLPRLGRVRDTGALEAMLARTARP